MFKGNRRTIPYPYNIALDLIGHYDEDRLDKNIEDNMQFVLDEIATDWEQDIIMALYCDKKTIKEYADELGITVGVLEREVISMHRSLRYCHADVCLTDGIDGYYALLKERELEEQEQERERERKAAEWNALPIEERLKRTDLYEADLPLQRLRTCLCRHGCRTLWDAANLTYEDLLEMRGSGPVLRKALVELFRDIGYKPVFEDEYVANEEQKGKQKKTITKE